MADANEVLVRRMYDAFSAGDGEAMSQILAPDIVWSTPGNNPTSGDHKGQEEVFAVFAKCGELTEGNMHLELIDVTVNGPTNVTSRHNLFAERPDGRKLEVVETESWTIEDGNITRVDESISDLAANDVFWS